MTEEERAEDAKKIRDQLSDLGGVLEDLVGAPIAMAEESTNRDDPLNNYDESYTWTFYRFAIRSGLS